MQSTLHFSSPSAASGCDALLLVGRRERLLAPELREFLPDSVQASWERMLESIESGDAGAATCTWTSTDAPARVVACVLPEPLSHHNTPARSHAITVQVRKNLGKEARVGVVLALDSSEHALAAGAAVARALPRFDGKGKREEASERTVEVGLSSPDGGAPDLARLGRLAEGIRLAARLVDAPPDRLHTDAFVDEARRVAEEVGAEIEVIRGNELVERGFGGLWGVGKAATHPPALVILSHRPEGARRTLAWVGKGIVYDTGGLSIKGKDHMPGMKIDMGGAAAVLGAFRTAALAGAKDTIHGLLCLAENSVGPDATRPDDILSMYSGRTVEVNNTDAEGRLVLADGVAYASKHLAPDVIVDLATLTGAQLVATGQRHAGIVCSCPDLESSTVRAGRASGDLAHPLPYCPEFFRAEFRSEVADMRNSVKNRGNAQSSCAGQFVAEHLAEDWDGKWLHIDMAGPVLSEDRGTGYGVALLTELFGVGA